MKLARLAAGSGRPGARTALRRGAAAVRGSDGAECAQRKVDAERLHCSGGEELRRRKRRTATSAKVSRVREPARREPVRWEPQAGARRLRLRLTDVFCNDAGTASSLISRIPYGGREPGGNCSAAGNGCVSDAGVHWDCPRWRERRSFTGPSGGKRRRIHESSRFQQVSSSASPSGRPPASPASSARRRAMKSRSRSPCAGIRRRRR